MDRLFLRRLPLVAAALVIVALWLLAAVSGGCERLAWRVRYVGRRHRRAQRGLDG